MKIAASILNCNNRINGVLELNNTNISYIHIDVMDGNFVSNTEFDNIDEIREINKITKYPMDVHLMMDNPGEYIKDLGNMNISFITVHLEIDKDKKEIFKEIRNLGYKVGLSIKPNTDINELVPYIDDVDMILVMSVEPGLGGQEFIGSTIDRIKGIRELINKSGKNIFIEVDGGINNDTILKLDGVDIVVVGSYITKSDNYYNKVEELLGCAKKGDSVDFAGYCNRCGNKLEDNSNFCCFCGTRVVLNELDNQLSKRKVGYGKCIVFTILGSLGIFLFGFIMSFIFLIVGIEVDLSFIEFGVPILGIVFSPLIALIIYHIKNK